MLFIDGRRLDSQHFNVFLMIRVSLYDVEFTQAMDTHASPHHYGNTGPGPE